MSDQKPINIILEGVCKFCNGLVNFLIDRDTNKQFKFASLQSSFGENVLLKNSLATDDYQSVIVLENEELFTKSSAIFKVIERLPNWRWLRIFKALPNFILDGIYGLIARNRYRIFGKRDSCRLPTPAERAKFIE
ncbi:MAG: DCC1-like thiol-disulfide oxidoreductase family protein [Spirosomataceae bacterium]